MKIIKTNELEKAKERKERALARNQKPTKVAKPKQTEKRKRKQMASVGYMGFVLMGLTSDKIFYAGMPDRRQRRRKAPKMRSKERIASSIRMEKL